MQIKTRIITNLGKIEDDFKPYTKAKKHEWIGFLQKACKSEADFIQLDTGVSTIIVPGELLRKSIIEIIEKED